MGIGRIILHVGANKTGSSAVQRFLSLNNGTLREEGIIIPNANFEVTPDIEGFHVWSFQQFIDSEDGQTRLEEAVDRINSDEPNGHCVVLSAENLAANPKAPELFSKLVKDYSVEMIIYVRRQDDYLLSSWQQWYSKIHSDFWAWLLTHVGKLGNWQSYISGWEEVLGRKNITVRIYDPRELLDGNIVDDIHSVLPIRENMTSLKRPAGNINPSYSDAILDLVKGNPAIFSNVHDNAFYGIVQELTGDTFHKRKNESPITFLQRKSIQSKYEASNRWVCENYFTGRNDLFSPIVEGDYVYPSPEAANDERLRFLTTFVYKMYVENKNG